MTDMTARNAAITHADRPVRRPPWPPPEHRRPPSISDRLLTRWSDVPPWAVVAQLFFGLGWLRAAGAKMISPDWWSGTTIEAFVAEHQATTLSWFEPILDVILQLGAQRVAVVVLALQIVVGLALAMNRRVALALGAAMSLNLTFLAIGAVNPSAFYLVGQGAIALWMVGCRAGTVRLSRDLRLTTVVAVALAAVSAPFVSTVHPSEVIDDPAVMMVMVGLLTALACELTHRARFGRGFL